MRFAISGSSGLIGSALDAALVGRGHQVLRLIRSGGDSPTEVLWDPDSGIAEAAALEGLDAVIHLAGAGIADKRWSAARKEVLVDSRVVGTRSLIGALGELDHPPRRFLSASAIGVYGERGDEILTEASERGSGFLADLSVAWESEASAAKAWADRVFTLRTGIVLSRSGGALAKMLQPFRLGLGGVLGSGEQYMSWISIEDEVGAILHLLDSSMLSGAVNLTGPKPVTNREFTRALGSTLRRPTILPVPAFAVRALFGQMGEEALLGSQRVAPAALEEDGFLFRHPTVTAALEAALG